MEITSIDSFLKYFDRLRGRTLRVFERVPPEQLEWRPGDGRFSFGDILRHLAGVERYMFAENALGRPSRYHGHGQELASGFDNVVAYAEWLHKETRDILATLSEEDLVKKTETPAGTPITVWKWLRAMTEHEVHHRGQIYLMLGDLGIETPPLFGLTAEEVQERSTPPESPSV